MKYIKKFESQNIKFGWIKNASIGDLTEESKKMLFNIFGTLKIPYNFDINNHSKYGREIIFENQFVTIKNVHADIIRKILKIYFLKIDNYYILKNDDKLNIDFSTGGIYTDIEISLSKRTNDNNMIDFSFPIAYFKNNKWNLHPGIIHVPNNKLEYKKEDLDKYQLEKDLNKYNL